MDGLAARHARVVAVVAGLTAVWAVGDNVLAKGLPVGIVVFGAVVGSLYALGAIGLVLVYRANRVVNFAQAELGAVAAVLAIVLVVQFDVNYFLAVATGFVGAAVLGAIVELSVVRFFRDTPRLILSVVTIGLATILNGFSIQIPLWLQGPDVTGYQRRQFTAPVSASFDVFPVKFHADHVVVMLTVPVVLIALTWFLRSTDYGVAIRAASENRDRANLLGVPALRLSTVVWAGAAFLSAITVVLRVPLAGFVSYQSVSGGGSSLLLRTLAAAVIGRMESLPLTAAAAIGLGIVQELGAWTFGTTAYVDTLLVGVILVALLVQRRQFSRALDTGISSWRGLREVRPVPVQLRGLWEVRWAKAGVSALVAGLALLYPLFASSAQEQLMGLVFIYAMVALSLVVLTGWAGQISLGQWALVGFGGTAAGVLMNRHGWDLFLALPVGMLVAAAVAVVVGLPALRITGPFLAVTTLAFATSAFAYFLEDRYLPWFVESELERPAVWERFPITQDWQVYYFALGALAFVVFGVRNLRRTRTGRAVIAVRDNELAAQAAGLRPTRLKLLAFGFSGAIAGLAGGLYVLHQGGLKTDAFRPEVSIRLFTMVVIGGLGSIPGAILGAFYVRGSEYFLPGGWSQIASGAGLVALLLVLPGGLGEGLYRARDWFLRRVAARHELVVPSVLTGARVDKERLEPSAPDERRGPRVRS